MRRYALILGLVCVVTVTALASTALSATGADVFMGAGPCGVLDGDGNLFVGPATYIDVITNNGKGNGMSRCRLSGVPNDTGKAAHWNGGNTGGACSVPGLGTTTDWKEVLSASGEATIICHFR